MPYGGSTVGMVIEDTELSYRYLGTWMLESVLCSADPKSGNITRFM